MSRTVTEKKSVKWITIIWLLAISVYGLAVILPIVAFKPSNIVANLTWFGGRVIPQQNIKPGTFTIEVSYAEAMTWGKDAILSYGEEGLEIWRPDNATSGVFQHYGDMIKADLSNFYYYKVQRNDKEIRLQSRIALRWPIAFGIWLLAMAVSVSGYVRNKMRKKYGDTT